jgi:hypothetical protein
MGNKEKFFLPYLFFVDFHFVVKPSEIAQRYRMGVVSN